jgi:hypothetical protein|tara:strand:+ start:150 stop:353 length:204 start_codon:yes stop_codon:yes gene_type:complete
MADYKTVIKDKEYELNNIKDLDDNDAKTLYEDLIELIELDWFNRSMQDNYRVYICEVERVLGSRGLL